jgi:hypothetical protein
MSIIINLIRKKAIKEENKLVQHKILSIKAVITKIVLLN